MIDDRENNEYADGYEDAPPGETGETEAPYENGLDDPAPRGMSTGVKVLVGCSVAFGGLVLLSTIAGLFLPVLLKGKNEAERIQCTNHFKIIYPLAHAYAAKKSEFPRDKSVDDPAAHDSLNILLDSEQGRGLEPRFFNCPAGDTEAATADPETGKFVLDENTLDYAWAMKETKAIGRAVPLAACAHHEGIVIVLFTDSHVETWELDDPEVKDKLDEGTGLPRGLGR